LWQSWRFISGKHGPVYGQLFKICPLFRYGRYPVKYLLTFNFSSRCWLAECTDIALREAGQGWLSETPMGRVPDFLGVTLVGGCCREGDRKQQNDSAALPVSMKGRRSKFHG
jgi:hypothetical protein